MGGVCGGHPAVATGPMKPLRQRAARHLPFLIALTVILSAYTLTGSKWDHKAITYSCGNPALAQAVKDWAAVSALEDGGCSANPDIILQVVDPWPYGANIAGVAGWASVGGKTTGCVISVKPTGVAHMGVITHEVGHCLGLGHSSEAFNEPNAAYRNASMYYACCNTIGADDRAGIVALYGPEPPPPLRLPMLVRD